MSGAGSHAAPRIPGPEMRFVWDHSRLSRREDMLVHALLELFMVNMITQRQAERGGGHPTAEDASEAIRHTVQWAARMFPDLGVAFSGA
jgi:hypothetical protein